MASALVWGISEFGGAYLGDKRRGMRAAKIASGILCDIGSAISSSCGAAGAQAVSRLFDLQEVNETSVLSKHIQRIKERCLTQDEDRHILVVQDTTILDFSGRNNISGLGHTCMSGGNGIMMHSALVLNTQKAPLGVLGTRFWCRDNKTVGINKLRASFNTLEKESSKWIWGLEQVKNHLCGFGKQILLIGDRESDMYDLFASDCPSDISILARISQNRFVKNDDEKTKLFDALDNSPVMGNYDLELPDSSRTAKLQVKSCSVVIEPPKRYKLINSRKVSVWLIDIKEVDVPEGAEPLHWRLMTTMYAGSFEDCKYIAKCYGARWTIEEFHKTLKSGCKVERLQFETISRLKPAIALLSVVACQVMYLTKYARSHPEAPATYVATEEEIETVESWVSINRYRNYEIKNMADYVRGIGFIGGFRGRKSDGEPGVQAVWQGIRGLSILVAGRKIERLKFSNT